MITQECRRLTNENNQLHIQLVASADKLDRCERASQQLHNRLEERVVTAETSEAAARSKCAALEKQCRHLQQRSGADGAQTKAAEAACSSANALSASFLSKSDLQRQRLLVWAHRYRIKRNRGAFARFCRGVASKEQSVEPPARTPQWCSHLRCARHCDRQQVCSIYTQQIMCRKRPWQFITGGTQIPKRSLFSATQSWTQECHLPYCRRASTNR